VIVRKLVTQVEETRREAGRAVDPPVRKALAAVVIENPLAGGYTEDLAPLFVLGAEVGALLADAALAALGGDGATLAGYGKGAIVGVEGELEHAAALIHPTFGAPVRAAIGGGKAIIPSTKLVGGPGCRIVVPITNRDDIWEFDDMDAAAIQIDDAPRPHEVVVVLALACGGRPLKRTRKAG
jgi:Amino acid synthesis